MNRAGTHSRTVAIALMALCTVLGMSVDAQDQTPPRGERLAVIPFVDSTSDGAWEHVARSMSQTIQLTLQLSGQYTVIETDAAFDPYAAQGPAQLSALAEEYRLDGAVIGRITPTERGRIELEAAVWNAAQGVIIGAQQREAFGAFDILNASDELVVLAASALLGYPVDFGALIVTPSRTDVPYVVRVDNVQIGEQVTAIPQLLSGRRRVEIAIRTANREQVVYAEDRLIRAGEAIEIPVALPRVTVTEQREIILRHELARELLGQVEQYAVAFETLSESRALLAATTSDALEELRREQSRLEALWQLDEEFARLSVTDVAPTGAYTVGDPLARLPGTITIATGDRSRMDGVASRIGRNGHALYGLVRLAWAGALSRSDWETAELLIDDLGLINATLQLGLTGSLERDRRAFEAASREADVASRRRGRPWPYIGAGVGFGVAGYGTYATVSTGADPVAEALGSAGVAPEIVGWVPVSAIVGGGILAVTSTVLAVRNARAVDNALREWARSYAGREMQRADELLTPPAAERARDRAAGEQTARVLVLGPVGALANIAGEPVLLPAVVEHPVGQAIDVGRATRVTEDRSRLLPAGTVLVVVE